MNHAGRHGAGETQRAAYGNRQLTRTQRAGIAGRNGGKVQTTAIDAQGRQVAARIA